MNSTECSLAFNQPILLGDGGPAAIVSEPAIDFGPSGEIAVASIWAPAEQLAGAYGGGVIDIVDSAASIGVGGPGGQNGLWISTDGGETFEAKHDERGRLSPEGHQGNGDADLAFTPDGRLHVVLFGSGGIEVLSSDDLGNSWTASGYISNSGVDRQWIAVDGNGDLVVSWHQFPANPGPPITTGDGVGLATSTDSGQTWDSSRQIHPTAFQRGPLVETTQGILIPVYEDNNLSIIGSTDGGSNWATYGVGTEADGAGYPGFEVLVEDSDQVIWLVWTEQGEDGTARMMVRSVSTDGWGVPTQTSPQSSNAVFGWPLLRPDGSLVIFSYQSESTGDPTIEEKTWNLAYDLRCSGSTEWAHGTVAEGVHVGTMCLDGSDCDPVLSTDGTNERQVGELFEAGVAPDGRVWVTWTGTSIPLEQASNVKSSGIWIAGETA